MIKKEEATRIIRYLNNEINEFDSTVKLNNDGIWEAEFEKQTILSIDSLEHLIKILNKKTYTNSLGEKFIVYVVEIYLENKLNSLNYLIKLDEKNFVTVQYDTKHGIYFLLGKNGYKVVELNITDKYDKNFSEKLTNNLKDIIINVCKETDELFKNKIKFLINKDERENAYFYINNLLLS